MTLDADACYLALKAHDARFDGRFFTGVTSTGIYCRPICRVRLPRRENCRFFEHAALAERAGFRPCLRCRPELAPRALAWSRQDASATLALQAARLLDDAGAWCAGAPSMPAVARRLGVSDRHLRRIFEAQFGVSPLHYLQTRRLLSAKQLLTDTALPVTQVALACGFTSVRRFNAAFVGQYGLNPLRLRRASTDARDGAARPLWLRWRPPYDAAAMLDHFARRGVAGVEAARADSLARTLALHERGQTLRGWLALRFDTARHGVELRVSDSLHPALPEVIRRVRAALDLDADPEAINAVLLRDFPGSEGARLPGCFDGFELAVRAVLGQQVTVAAARTLATRLAGAFGEPLATPWPALTRLFPTPQALRDAADDALGALGITRQRQTALRALADATLQGRIALHPAADPAATLTALRQLPGIGDWTAHYIALRALRWPDAFPAGDVALHKALGLQGRPQAAREAEARAQGWRPWRGYATQRAWQALARDSSGAGPGTATSTLAPDTLP